MFDNNTKALESFMDYSAMMIAEESLKDVKNKILHAIDVIIENIKKLTVKMKTLISKVFVKNSPIPEDMIDLYHHLINNRISSVQWVSQFTSNKHFNNAKEITQRAIEDAENTITELRQLNMKEQFEKISVNDDTDFIEVNFKQDIAPDQKAMLTLLKASTFLKNKVRTDSTKDDDQINPSDALEIINLSITKESLFIKRLMEFARLSSKTYKKYYGHQVTYDDYYEFIDFDDDND